MELVRWFDKGKCDFVTLLNTMKVSIDGSTMEKLATIIANHELEVVRVSVKELELPEFYTQSDVGDSAIDGGYCIPDEFHIYPDVFFCEDAYPFENKRMLHSRLGSLDQDVIYKTHREVITERQQVRTHWLFIRISPAKDDRVFKALPEFLGRGKDNKGWNELMKRFGARNCADAVMAELEKMLLLDPREVDKEWFEKLHDVGVRGYPGYSELQDKVWHKLFDHQCRKYPSLADQIYNLRKD